MSEHDDQNSPNLQNESLPDSATSSSGTNSSTLSSDKLTTTNLSPTQKCMYLQDLLRDRVQLESMPKGLFVRLSAVLDAEIEFVNKQLFSNDSKTLTRKFLAPEAANITNYKQQSQLIMQNQNNQPPQQTNNLGLFSQTTSQFHQNSNSSNNNTSHSLQKVSLPDPNPNEKITKKQRKIYMPVEKYPTFNFVGRIVGPRGRTIKEIEHKTGVKLLVRGRGSMRNSQVEEMKRGKPNYEHLNETLHVILQCEDGETRAKLKLDAAEGEIRRLINPELENGRDDIKKKQLTELAILNGTYNPCGPVKQVSPPLQINAGFMGNGGIPGGMMTNGMQTVIQPSMPQQQVFVDPNTNQVYRTPVIYTTAPQMQDTANYGAQPVTYQYVQAPQIQTTQAQVPGNNSSGGGKVQPMRMIQKNTLTHSPY